MLPERKINFSKPNSLSLQMCSVFRGLHPTILYHWSNHFTIWESDLQLIHLEVFDQNLHCLKLEMLCILLHFFSAHGGWLLTSAWKLFQTKIIIASHYSLELWISIACSPCVDQAVGLLLGSIFFPVCGSSESSTLLLCRGWISVRTLIFKGS